MPWGSRAMLKDSQAEHWVPSGYSPEPQPPTPPQQEARRLSNTTLDITSHHLPSTHSFHTSNFWVSNRSFSRFWLTSASLWSKLAGSPICGFLRYTSFIFVMASLKKNEARLTTEIEAF